jgi:hypothetical protein
MGTDLFVYHGYTEFFPGGRWVKATPTFNAELCRRYRVSPVDFDGIHDALLPECDRAGRPSVAYVDYHGVHDDVPVAVLVAAWKSACGVRRVEAWIAAQESGETHRQRSDKASPLH